jgi:hypothetical protein
MLAKPLSRVCLMPNELEYIPSATRLFITANPQLRLTGRNREANADCAAESCRIYRRIMLRAVVLGASLGCYSVKCVRNG